MPHTDRIEQLRLRTENVSDDVTLHLYNTKGGLTKSQATIVVQNAQSTIAEIERELEQLPTEQRDTTFQRLCTRLKDLRTECVQRLKRIGQSSGQIKKCGF